MKKVNFLLLAIISLVCLSSCGNGSSGTKEIDLGETRFYLGKESSGARYAAMDELLLGMFSVVPGPCVFTWEELTMDGASGYELCRTSFKIKLKKNYSIEFSMGDDSQRNHKDDEKYQAQRFANMWMGILLDSNGDKLDGSMLSCVKLDMYISLDGHFTENTDGLLDFYHFATSAAPGSEYVLELYGGVFLCKDIEKTLNQIKSFKICCSAGDRWNFPGKYEYDIWDYTREGIKYWDQIEKKQRESQK